MEFELGSAEYRLTRGVSSGMWCLFKKYDDRIGWRLEDTFPAHIPDEDVFDYVVLSLRSA